VFSKFKGFAKRTENEFDFKIEKIRSDNGPSSRTLELKIIVMKRESNINFQPNTLYNKMELLKGRIRF
jgi:hypothetical protein